MTAQIALLVLLVACSFIVSGSETALFALTRQQRRSFAESTNRFKRLASALMAYPRRVLMTVLIVNTTVNVGIFAVSYVTFSARTDSGPVMSAIGGISAMLVVILFGEIIPKAIALAHAPRMAPIVAPVISGLQVVTGPVRELLRLTLVEPITRLLSPSGAARIGPAGSDLQSLLEISADRGLITTHEHDMLQAVVLLPSMLVRSVMVPRVSIRAVDVDATSDDALAMFRETGLKKVPAYGRNLDDIRGVLHARDIHLNPGRPIRELLRPPRYVPENINLLQLIRHFRSTRTKFALVVDEFGGISGLVALEDVLEEIVGELGAADRAIPDAPIERIDERTFRVPGGLNVHPWRSLLGIAGSLPGVDTIGGVVLAQLGRLPRVGDRIQLGNLSITVDRLDGRRIDSVVLRLEPRPSSGASGGTSEQLRGRNKP